MAEVKLTGAATAAADDTRMIVIVGNTPSHHHAKEVHQSIRMHADASQGDIFRPICKRVGYVDQPQWLTDIVPRTGYRDSAGFPTDGNLLD